MATAGPDWLAEPRRAAATAPPTACAERSGVGIAGVEIADRLVAQAGIDLDRRRIRLALEEQEGRVDLLRIPRQLSALGHIVDEQTGAIEHFRQQEAAGADHFRKRLRISAVRRRAFPRDGARCRVEGDQHPCVRLDQRQAAGKRLAFLGKRVGARGVEHNHVGLELKRRQLAHVIRQPDAFDRNVAYEAGGKATTVGTPMRPAILAAAAIPFASPEPNGPLRILVVGGSQGALVMSDIMPPAVERLEPVLWSRLVLTQQVREEDMARVRAVYDRLKINAELAPFFSDLPARLSSSHLVVSRSGAGTVAELAGSRSSAPPEADVRPAAAALARRSRSSPTAGNGIFGCRDRELKPALRDANVFRDQTPN